MDLPGLVNLGVGLTSVGRLWLVTSAWRSACQTLRYLQEFMWFLVIILCSVAHLPTLPQICPLSISIALFNPSCPLCFWTSTWPPIRSSCVSYFPFPHQIPSLHGAARGLLKSRSQIRLFLYLQERYTDALEGFPAWDLCLALFPHHLVPSCSLLSLNKYTSPLSSTLSAP